MTSDETSHKMYRIRWQSVAKPQHTGISTGRFRPEDAREIMAGLNKEHGKYVHHWIEEEDDAGP